MKPSELRVKSVDELGQELIGLRREQFNLRMQRGAGQLANPMRFNAVRKDIARIKTVLTEKAGEKGTEKVKAETTTKSKVEAKTKTKTKTKTTAKTKTKAEKKTGTKQ